MAYTQGQLDAITNAIASGVTSVSYEGKTTTFASLDVLLRVQAIIQNALGVAPSPSATLTVSHDRGYGGFSSVTGDDSELISGA